MTKQVLIVLDNPPLERDSWADEVFRQARLAPTSNSEVSAAMSADAETRKALLEHAADPMVAAEALAPHYRRAFDKLYRDVPRVGLYGTAWLVYAPVDVCIVDWLEVERRATAPGVAPSDGDNFRQQSMAFVHARAAKHLKPGRLLELQPGLSDAERVSQSLAFFKQHALY